MAPKITCQIQDCERRTIGDAPWCVPHLRQMSIAGDPLAGRPPSSIPASAPVMAPGEPAGRPKSATSRRELWEAYARELGADPAALDGFTKRELIAKCDELEAAVPAVDELPAEPAGS